MPRLLRKRGRGPVAGPSQYDIIRRIAYNEGAREMRESIVRTLTWEAEYAPSPEAADYLWQVIMDTKGARAPKEIPLP